MERQIAASALLRSYVVAVVSGMLATLGIFCLFLFSLDATGNLPPPAFSNSLCADEKLNFMRDNPMEDPNLLIVGSSVAWRHVDSEVLSDQAPGVKPFNGAFCGLHANQTLHVADWLLDREPSVEAVVMLVDPLDFANCSTVPDAVFDRRDADDFVYGDAWRWQYYLRYFSPVSLTRNAAQVKKQRSNEIEMNPLVITRFGDGPLNTAQSRGLFYGQPDPLEPDCFSALRELAERLEGEGRSFMVVATPLHPRWKEKEDPTGEFIASFDRALIDTLDGTGARFWDADNEWAASPEAFVDAIHMRWSAVQMFSKELATHLPQQADDQQFGAR